MASSISAIEIDAVHKEAQKCPDSSGRTASVKEKLPYGIREF
jgi:hypothetical protein